MIWPQIVMKGPDLPLNSSFFLFKTEELSSDELQNMTSMGDVIRREQVKGNSTSEHSELLEAMQSLLSQGVSAGAGVNHAARDGSQIT